MTDKLDEITVLRKFRDTTGVLTISETEDKTGKDIKPDKNVFLDEIKVTAIPIDGNVWIFENEFDQQQNIQNKLINDQKGAFTSAGKKVEKRLR